MRDERFDCPLARAHHQRRPADLTQIICGRRLIHQRFLCGTTSHQIDTVRIPVAERSETALRSSPTLDISGEGARRPKVDGDDHGWSAAPGRSSTVVGLCYRLVRTCARAYHCAHTCELALVTATREVANAHCSPSEFSHHLRRCRHVPAARSRCGTSRMNVDRRLGKFASA
jgi:hypothetical protein